MASHNASLQWWLRRKSVYSFVYSFNLSPTEVYWFIQSSVDVRDELKLAVSGVGGTIANAPNNLDTHLKQYTNLIRRPTYDAHRGGRMPMSERAQLAHLKRTIARRNAASNNRNRLVQFHGLIARGKP